jgi:MerR family transcriptional regulator, copper efflux regulator
MEDTMESMGIGTLARRAGVSIDTVRYYEKSGLLAPEGRRASGYRRYSEQQLLRLQFIRRAKGLGFTLKDIRDLLGLSKQRDVARVKRAAESKLQEVEQKILALQRVQNGLKELVTACPGHGQAHDCPILRALSSEASP